MNEVSSCASLTIPAPPASALAKIRQALNKLHELHEWHPADGDTLEGALAGIQPREGPFGAGHILLIRDEQGILWGLWLTKFLRDQLESYHAEAGDLIGIRYLGKGISRAGKNFNCYDVVVAKPQEDDHGRPD